MLGLLGWGLLLAGYLAWAATRLPGAILYSHNETERTIFSYFVNGNWGGNAFAYGGGKATCCWRIEGETLKVEWIKSRTGEQLRQGVQKETLSIKRGRIYLLLMPPYRVALENKSVPFLLPFCFENRS